MNFLETFKDWINNNSERKMFKEAWSNKYGDTVASNWSDSTISYNQDLAYQIFKLTQRIEDLEAKIK